jgi:hypothetical protein
VSGSRIQLAPPGAGLPFVEMTLSRIGFGIMRRALTASATTQGLRKETTRIESLCEGLPEERVTRTVLIPRIWGLEDSSRNWSIAMTLAHLNIVNPAIMRIIECLRRGEVYPHQVLIAEVKPPLDATGAELQKLKEIMNRFLGCAAAWGETNKGSKGTHAHPWFGPLDAHGWHCLAAIHQSIHRRQIQAILQGI